MLTPYQRALHVLDESRKRGREIRVEDVSQVIEEAVQDTLHDAGFYRKPIVYQPLIFVCPMDPHQIMAAIEKWTKEGWEHYGGHPIPVQENVPAKDLHGIPILGAVQQTMGVLLYFRRPAKPMKPPTERDHATDPPDVRISVTPEEMPHFLGRQGMG